jgi:hypothetical protein
MALSLVLLFFLNTRKPIMSKGKKTNANTKIKVLLAFICGSKTENSALPIS